MECWLYSISRHMIQIQPYGCKSRDRGASLNLDFSLLTVLLYNIYFLLKVLSVETLIIKTSVCIQS